VWASLNALFTNLSRSLGPVRAVAFHPSRQLLCTGGDDYKIKVWGEVPAICSLGFNS
jgi:WD40 repeat protein